MDFDTGSRPEAHTPGGSGARPLGVSASAGGEFNLSDPLSSFVWTVKSLVTTPAAFFRGTPRDASLINPLAFHVICSLIAVASVALLDLLFGLAAGPSEGTASALYWIFGVFVDLLLYPLGTAIGLFIVAGILHLFVVLLLRPLRAGFGATFRVAAYGGFLLDLPNVLGLRFSVPTLINLAGVAVGVYAVVLYVPGIREAHATTTGRAALVALAPVAVSLALLVLVLGLL